MAKKLEIASTKKVKSRLPVFIEKKSILRTLSVAGEAHLAALALSWKLLAFVVAELLLLRGGYQPVEMVLI